jgi:Schlafen, AlbA_2
MIFLDRPIAVQHVREVCQRFNEGLRVEYKRTFDQSVRDQLPKIVSSFANSHGGVLVIGVRTTNGVPQAPFEGFAAQPREEYPLTVENICLRNINPPIFARTQVVQSDAPGQVFLVIEVDESAEAPHAIENSRNVYVRTGSAANPYDLAEVDLIIELVKRRRERLERRDRLLRLAEERSHYTVQYDRPFAQISICPTFPRSALCTSQQAWEFLGATQFTAANLIPPNSMKRIPDGAASMTRAVTNAQVQAQYVELGKYGLLFAKRQFALTTWAGTQDPSEQLSFADLFQPLLNLTFWANRFYVTNGYTGNLVTSVLLRHVNGRAMRFVPGNNMFLDHPDDCRCHSDLVSAERFVTVEELGRQRVEVLTEVLAELTWAFWQSNQDFPLARLRQSVQQAVQ